MTENTVKAKGSSKANSLYGLVTGILQLLRSLFVKLLAKYFVVVPLPKSLSDVVSQHESTIIITESSSLIIEALLRSFARRSNLRGPLNLNRSTEKIFEKNFISWISLHSKENIQKIVSTSEQISFVTLNTFSGRGPFKRDPHYRLGFWDLFGILVTGRFLIIFFGKPIRAHGESNLGSTSLIRSLKVDFYKNLKIVRGTPFHAIERQAELVLGGHDFNNEVTQISSKQNESPNKLKRKARGAFYDIAANPRRPMYRIVAFVARVIINRLFSSVQTLGLERVEQAVRESTVVIVPMHRSHLDYIIIGSELYRSHMNPPLVAAGINLSFWPIGFIIRSVGGYFVKRNVRNDRLHALILKRYVAYLVKRGYLQEFFIEGGRSRSGRMRQPKLGLLSVFVDAQMKGEKRNIVFVPTAITYENVIEGHAYGRENTGKDKEKENLLSLLKASSIFKKKYGDAVINFGNPISLSEFLNASKNQNKVEARSNIQNLANHITRAIREQTNPSITSLVHAALLMAPRYGMTKQELSQSIKNLCRLLTLARSCQSQIGENTPSLKSFLEGREQILLDIARGDTIKIVQCINEQVFFIPGERRFTADFYKNSTLHIFLPISILSILHLLETELTPENTLPYFEVFTFDFILGDKENFLTLIGKLIAALEKDGIIKRIENRLRFVDLSSGLFIPALLLANIESILWSSRMLTTMSKDPSTRSGDESAPALEYEEVIKRLQSEFRPAAYLGRASCTEASSNVNLVSALDTLQNLGLVNISERSGTRNKLIIKKEGWDKLNCLIEAEKALILWQQKQLRLSQSKEFSS